MGIQKKMRKVFALCIILGMAGLLYAQTDIQDPWDKYLENDRYRLMASEELEKITYTAEAAIMVTAAPLPLDLKVLPTLIKAEPYIPDIIAEPDLKVLTLLSATSDGTGPVKGQNYIRMYINNSSSVSGSEADYIYMRFGNGYKIQLNGYSGAFPRGYILTWDLNSVSGYLNGIPQDRWDEVSLETVSSDGILIDRLIIVHSSQEILDWNAGTWLDKWNGTYLGLASKILDRKLESVNDTNNASVHFGAREIGKTDGDKYGTGGAWCSEFASWCLQKSGVMTPAGSIGTTNMKNWFDDRGRLYTPTEVKNKIYVPVEGDYLSLFDGGHSAVFYRWVDATATITDTTRFQTIEGNAGGTVLVTTRTVADIDRVGRTE